MFCCCYSCCSFLVIVVVFLLLFTEWHSSIFYKRLAKGSFIYFLSPSCSASFLLQIRLRLLRPFPGRLQSSAARPAKESVHPPLPSLYLCACLPVRLGHPNGLCGPVRVRVSPQLRFLFALLERVALALVALPSHNSGSNSVSLCLFICFSLCLCTLLWLPACFCLLLFALLIFRASTNGAQRVESRANGSQSVTNYELVLTSKALAVLGRAGFNAPSPTFAIRT